MAEGRFIAYYRVSTERQGRSGLGLEAQQAAVRAYLNGGNWTLVAELVEIESGKHAERPKLQEALALCRIHGATLIIAKLDRLSRDAHFLLGLKKAGVRFLAADMPDANETVVGLMAVIADAERKMISARTKAALQAAKARGTALGAHRPGAATLTEEARAKGREIAAETRSHIAARKAEDLVPVIRSIQAQGAKSLRQIAAALNDRGIPTARGGQWSAVQVARVLDRGAA